MRSISESNIDRLNYANFFARNVFSFVQKHMDKTACGQKEQHNDPSPPPVGIIPKNKFLSLFTARFKSSMFSACID